MEPRMKLPVLNTNVVTNSSLACFRRCPKQFYYKYVVGLRRRSRSRSLVLGSGVHRAIETGSVVEAVREIPGAFDAAEVRAVYRAYCEHWGNSKHLASVVGREIPFEIEIQGYKFAGKMDGVGMNSRGELVLHEIKTSSEDITPGSPYWLRVLKDPQIRLYAYAYGKINKPIDGVLYDVIRVPGNHPYTATKNIKYRRDGKPYANQRLADETPAEYEQRCYEDIKARGDASFVREQIYLSSREIQETIDELVEQATAAMSGKQRWTNSQACVQYGRFCEYIELCPSEVITIPEGFEIVDDVHPELKNAPTAHA